MFKILLSIDIKPMLLRLYHNNETFDNILIAKVCYLVGNLGFRISDFGIVEDEKVQLLMKENCFRGKNR
jgi:hypothetical protein